MTTPTASDVVIDSSGWLEYITADSKCDLFAPYFEGGAWRILVPTSVLYEVRKILLLRQPKAFADLFVSEALNRTLIPLDEKIALDAAALGIQYQLAMADAVIYASAQARNAELVTSDSHFSALHGVTMI